MLAAGLRGTPLVPPSPLLLPPSLPAPTRTPPTTYTHLPTHPPSPHTQVLRLTKGWDVARDHVRKAVETDVQLRVYHPGGGGGVWGGLRGARG